jgi:hypothetical protein
MKKALLSIIAIAIAHSSFAQWTTGTNINNTNTGNVGIGITNPGTKLAVVDASGTSQVSVASFSNSTNSSYTTITASGSSSVVPSWVNGSQILEFVPYSTGSSIVSAYTGSLLFQTNGRNNRMAIDPNGNVGIGTTNPISKLSILGVGGDVSDIKGNPTGNVGVSVQNLGSGSAQYRFLNSSGVEKGAITLVNSLETGGHGTLVFFDGTGNVLNLNNGNVGIGTLSPDAKLAVKGTIHTQEVKVDLQVPGPDYVFNDDYKLITLTEIKDYVTKNHHLPEIPSASQMAKDGINLGDMNTKLLKKVEELTLYAIDQQKQLTEQQKINQALQEQISQLAKKIKN